MILRVKVALCSSVIAVAFGAFFLGECAQSGAGNWYAAYMLFFLGGYAFVSAFKQLIKHVE